MPGLAAPGEIIVDRWGIPHIYAATQPDAFRLQGFNAARDRLWQIDLWRRRGLGRLSAALGRSYLEQDRAARLFLYRGDLAREYAAYGDDAEQIATAFAEGVNAYIDQIERGAAPLPVEFAALGYRPERWAAEDVVRIRSHGLVSNLSDQVDRALVLREFGRKAEALRKRLEPRWRYEVPEGLDLDAIPDDVLDVYELAIAPVEFAAPAGAASRRARVRQGSNNWTIAPRRTATGRPILANDPHRTQGVPSLRYLAHIVAPGLNVIGAGEPALPGISIGHNEHIAFGLTIFAIDQEDLYVYETREGEPDEYRYRDGLEPMTVVEEEIPVKDARARARDAALHPARPGDRRRRAQADRLRGALGVVRAGHLRVLRLDLVHARGQLDRVRPRAAPLGRPRREPGLRRHVRAHRLEAVRVRAHPPQLGRTAPGAGRRALRVGRLPRPRSAAGRARPEARLDRDGQRGEPAARLSRTGAARSASSGPRRSGCTASSRCCAGSATASVGDSRRLQVDHRSLQAARTIPLLAHLEPRSRRTARAIRLLRRWDRVLAPDSGAAALFEIWNSIELPTAVLRAALGSQKAVDAIWPGDPTVILELLEHPDRRLGRHPRRARDRALLTSLERAIDRTEALLGTRWSRWEWGKLHVAHFEHPIAPAVDKALARRLAVGPVPVGGGGETVGDTGYSTDGPPEGARPRARSSRSRPAPRSAR